MHILNRLARRKNSAAVALGRRGGRRSRVNLSPEQRNALARKAVAARWKVPIDQFAPTADTGVVWLWGSGGSLLEVVPVADASSLVRSISGSIGGPRKYAAFATFDSCATFEEAQNWTNVAIEFLNPEDQTRKFGENQ